MFRSASVAIMSPNDTATTRLSGGTIPIIAFGDRANAFEITLNSQTLTTAEQADWLRAFAAQVLDLADEIDARAIDLAEHIADANPDSHEWLGMSR